jgi:L-ascorbate metabolism protein UlaG (beta-lactamase superfamily)
MPRRLTLIVCLSTLVLVMASTLFCSTAPVSTYAGSPQYADGKFRNPVPKPVDGVAKMAGIVWKMLFDKPQTATPDQPIPVQALTQAALLAAPDQSLWRLGHSTMLLKLDGKFWLTDPVFSERASPFQFIGPKRFHETPLTIDELPPIAGVILSHDHYDHLDHAAILKLAPKVAQFLTPLGVGQRLIDWGVPAEKVQQFDWWQGTTIGGLRLVATPAQHFSGRSLSDGNSTLWASWVLMTADTRIFFSGDTGYFAGFKEIGERFGPFDLTMIETGAYDPAWPYVHMQPEQSLQAHLDVRGRHLMPIHNGTFDLSFHPWTEPFERISALAATAGVPLTAPHMGERLDLRAPAPSTSWWREASR